MITVKGKKNGKIMTVTADKENGRWHYLFNGKPNAEFTVEVDILLMTGHPLMATYWPQSKPLKIAAALEAFMDTIESGEIIDPEAEAELASIEQEEGAIY